MYIVTTKRSTNKAALYNFLKAFSQVGIIFSDSSKGIISEVRPSFSKVSL